MPYDIDENRMIYKLCTPHGIRIKYWKWQKIDSKLAIEILWGCKRTVAILPTILTKWFAKTP